MTTTTTLTKLTITLVTALTACGGVPVQRDATPFLPSR